ncbi:DUF664 domain-containing protein [Nocardioides sp.]|uniref:mycothiol transferase n=1 Tax=Nocardioides sp. TaxID=35761 RepID=UPI003528C499
MSEEQRAAEPIVEPPATGEYGARRFADYLDWLRADLAGAVLALSPEEQSTSRLASGWTPLELLSHVLHMEQRWFVWGFLGERIGQPWGDWTVEEPWTSDVDGDTRPGARWQVPEGTSAEQLAERLAATGRRTREILLAHPIHTPAAPGGRFGDDPPTLEWICFHVLAEYARHAGHLDVVVELAAEGPTD